MRPGAGGGSVRTHEINKRLAESFEITVVCARYRGSTARVQDGVRYVHVGLPLGYFPSIVSYFLSIPYALARYRSDLVVEDFGAPLSSVAVPWMTTRPTVGVVQWLFAKQKSAQYRFPFWIFERLGVRSHRTLVAVSPAVSDALQEMNPLAEVITVPNGLEGDARIPRSLRRSEIRYLGRLEIAQKGLDLLFRAYASIAGSIEQDLLIAGDGPDGDSLHAMAAELGISAKVKFVGRIHESERLDWLASAELVVMPSRYESFGMVAAESLAMSTPVVAFDIACLRDLVDDTTGALARPYDADDFATKLSKLAGDPELRAELGAKGPQRVAGLDWDYLAGQQGDVYRRCLGLSGNTPAAQNTGS